MSCGVGGTRSWDLTPAQELELPYSSPKKAKNKNKNKKNPHLFCYNTGSQLGAGQ